MKGEDERGGGEEGMGSLEGSAGVWLSEWDEGTMALGDVDGERCGEAG
jgi:hypothetical protein